MTANCAAALDQRDRNGEHEHQDDELRAREDPDDERDESDDVARVARCVECALQREHDPQERRKRRGLGQQEARQHVPRREQRERGNAERPGTRQVDSTREQVRRHCRRRVENAVQNVCGDERTRCVEQRVERRQQHRIELRRGRHVLAAERRQQRAVSDRRRELGVLELMRHHDPITDA